MIWPERPTCHDGDNEARRITQAIDTSIAWRGPIDEPPASGRLTFEPFRSCSYCGSIHPEDLFTALNAGAELNGSDWKYGWPHKFYVDRIPNPHPDREVWRGGYSGPKYRCRTCGFEPPRRHGRSRSVSTSRIAWTIRSPANIGRPVRPVGPFVHGKFYKTHLADISDEETFVAFAKLLSEKSGIEWTRDQNGVKYKAPHSGYQRSTLKA